MSTYEMQRCLFDHLRRLESGEETDPKRVRVTDYDLSPDERSALETPDIGQLYELGTHPVFINAFCRAMGWKRADYAVLFPEGLADRMRNNKEARWLKS